MIFTASTGSSLLYWGTIEWIYYYQSPPFGAEVGSWQAAEWASAYGMFHWGATAWAMYAVVSVAIAYVYHVKKQPILRLSEACRGLLGDRVDGPIGKMIDLFFVFGLIGGVTTSMGLGTPMLTAGICKLTGMQHTQGLELMVITFWTLSIGATVYLGLEKGIKRFIGFKCLLSFWCTWIFITVWRTYGVYLESNNICFRFNVTRDYPNELLDGCSRSSEASTVVDYIYWAWWLCMHQRWDFILPKYQKVEV